MKEIIRDLIANIPKFHEDENVLQADGLKNAAVIIPILLNEDDSSVLLLKRASNLNFHSGEICFPGGTFEREDLNLANTAYRELFEETGIYKDTIEAIYPLAEEVTRTGFRIKPFLGIINKKIEIVIDGKEIVDYMLITLSEFMADNIKREYYLLIDNYLTSKPAFIIKKELVWGATANMLNEFLYILGSKSKNEKY